MVSLKAAPQQDADSTGRPTECFVASATVTSHPCADTGDLGRFGSRVPGPSATRLFLAMAPQSEPVTPGLAVCVVVVARVLDD